MKISGTYSIDAPREEVWSAINDIEVLARTIPGCQKLEQVGENVFESTLKVGLQAVKGVYHGSVTLSDIKPPHSYRIVVDGKGSNGFLHGEGGVELEDDAGKTKLIYSGNANIGGTLATVGQRLIEGASRTLINQALKALDAQVQARIAAKNAPPEPEPASMPAAAEQAMGAVASAVETITAVAEKNGVAIPEPITNAAAAVERKVVELAEHEQLKPESLVIGAAQDFLKERPWLPWVLVAFLAGWFFGRRK